MPTQRASKSRPSPRKASDPRGKTVVLEKDFAGIRAGSCLYIATPEVFRRYLHQVPRGETRSIARVRNELARQHQADATCPVTTAIFLRSVADDAWYAIEAGVPPDEVAPFWRVIDPETPLARRLRCDRAWLAQRRMIEAEALV